MNTIQQPSIDWPTGLTMQGAVGGEIFPFVEDENCNVTGYGHQDKNAFAEALNRYDEEATGETLAENDRWTADDITHTWAVEDPTDDERLIPTHPTTPGAMPLTTLWGAR